MGHLFRLKKIFFYTQSWGLKYHKQLYSGQNISKSYLVCGLDLFRLNYNKGPGRKSCQTESLIYWRGNDSFFQRKNFRHSRRISRVRVGSLKEKFPLASNPPSPNQPKGAVYPVPRGRQPFDRLGYREFETTRNFRHAMSFLVKLTFG